MDSKQVSVEEVARRVRAHRGARVCVATVRDGDVERVRYAEIHVNGLPYGWWVETWRYSTGSFVAVDLTGDEAARLVEGTLDAIGEVAFAPVATHERASVERHSSFMQYGLQQHPRPVTRSEVSLSDAPRTPTGRDVLVGQDDEPTFLGYPEAFAAFFRMRSSRGAQNLPMEQIIVTEIDDRGWFERIILSPSTMKVVVDGTAVAGARVELNAPELLQSDRVDGPCEWTFVLPPEFHLGATLTLTKDGEWLDLRQFSGMPVRTNDPSIEWESPAQAIESLVYGGESSTVELKERLPGPSRDDRRGFLKTVVAFANGEGGTIVFGATDDLRLVGLNIENPDAAVQQVTNIVMDTVDPAPSFHVRSEQIDGKSVLAVEVDSSLSVTSLGRDKPEFYIRRGSSTYQARRDDVVGLVQARSASRDRWPRF